MTAQQATTCGASPMDRQIFDQGLTVLATSAYIIIAALQSDGVKPTLTAISGRWNEKPQELEKALNDLQEKNIIVRHPAEIESEGPIFLVNPAAMWQKT